MVYQSKQNPLIKSLASLKDKKGRRELNSYMVEGKKMVFEAIKYNQPITYIVKEEGFLEEVPPSSAQIITVTKQVFSYYIVVTHRPEYSCYFLEYQLS